MLARSGLVWSGRPVIGHIGSSASLLPEQQPRSVIMKLIGRVALASALLLGLGLPAGTTQEAAEDAVLITVNDEPIYASEIRYSMRGIAGKMQRQGIKPEQNQLLQSATQEVIQTQLLFQEARRQGIKIDPAEINQAVAEIEQQAGGREKLMTELDSVGMSYERWVEVLGESDAVRRFVESKIQSTVTVKEEEVAGFYTSNEQRFNTPEQVRARHILFQVEQGAGAEVKQAAKAKAEKARQRALAGEDFAALAMELSEGPSGPRGGDLGFFAANRMVQPFSEAAFALQPGGISGIVETQFGYHVIKVEERREGGHRNLDEVGEEIKLFLSRQKVSEKVGELLERLEKEASIVTNDEVLRKPE
jgi:peptidyl-prolyl cis-trans isomerase C